MIGPFIVGDTKRLLDLTLSITVLKISPFYANGITWFFAIERVGDPCADGLITYSGVGLICGREKSSVNLAPGKAIVFK
jgi:hypothetical protein